MRKTIASLILVSILLSACNQGPIRRPGQVPQVQTKMNADNGEGNPNFDIVKTAVFEPHCMKCHNETTQKGDVRLDQYEDAFAARNDIRDDLQRDKMPRKAPHLPQDLKDLVYKWIDMGAPR